MFPTIYDQFKKFRCKDKQKNDFFDDSCGIWR